MRKIKIMALTAAISVSMVIPVLASYHSGPGAEISQSISEDVKGPAVGGMVEEISGDTAEWLNVDENTGCSIRYENLEQLLMAGNLDLKTQIDSQTSSRKNYQELLETLREEQDYMKFLAEASDEDSDEEKMYRDSANDLAKSAANVSRQLKRLNSRSNTAALQDVIDTYLITAQSRYKSYKKMALHVAAKEKSTAAAERVWLEMVKRQSAGLVTADDVLQALDQYEQQKNLLASYQQQEKEQRRQLFALLGFSETDLEAMDVVIEAVSAPDLAAMEAIDFEADCQKAVNNNSGVQNERHAKAGTSYEIERKAVTVTEAEGSAEAAFVNIYQQLLAQKASYQAAIDAYESAKISWNTAQLKKQAGMLDATAWLECEASWLQAEADYQSASMDLVQAYEDYLWNVKGI